MTSADVVAAVVVDVEESDRSGLGINLEWLLMMVTRLGPATFVPTTEVRVTKL